MRKVILISLALGVASVGMSQMPPDVPQGHWASAAVTNLYSLGILKGYPDGQFRGSRPVTRYELGQAVKGLFGAIQGNLSASQSNLIDLRSQIERHSADYAGLAALRERMDGLDGKVARLQSVRPEIDDLQSRFQKMLDQLQKLHDEVRQMDSQIKK